MQDVHAHNWSLCEYHYVSHEPTFRGRMLSIHEILGPITRVLHCNLTRHSFCQQRPVLEASAHAWPWELFCWERCLTFVSQLAVRHRVWLLRGAPTQVPNSVYTLYFLQVWLYNWARPSWVYLRATVEPLFSRSVCFWLTYRITWIGMWPYCWTHSHCQQVRTSV